MARARARARARPECVNDLKGFKDVASAMKKVILGLANIKAGFDEVEEADVTQLL